MRTQLAFILLLLLLFNGNGFSNGPKPIWVLSGGPADANNAFDDQTVYRIELLVSKEPIYLAPANFKGLENVEEYYENGMFFYTSGYSLDYSYARDVLLNQIVTSKPKIFIRSFCRLTRFTFCRFRRFRFCRVSRFCRIKRIQ